MIADHFEEQARSADDNQYRAVFSIAISLKRIADSLEHISQLDPYHVAREAVKGSIHERGS